MTDVVFGPDTRGKLRILSVEEGEYVLIRPFHL
jgi:hypothetical protein